MSLFERIKNIRYDLQEKRKFPGDESGAYKQAKDDLEARKGFSKNKPGGLKADEKNPYVKRSVRKARVDKLGGDIYDAPKFTQKGFEKSLKDTQKVGDKAFKSDVKKFKKIGLKPPKRGDFTSKSRPGGKLVIPDPFGKGDTSGETRVKGLEKKAFKKTKPSDIKLPKSFTDFERNLQDYKDRDKATMRTGKSSSKVKVSGANNLSRQDVGMAPPDKPKVVKQSEVSKKAKAFTNQIAQQKKAKTNKVVDLATKKQQSKLSQTAKDLEKQTGKIDAAKQKLRSATGTKDVKKIRQLNVQGREYRKLTQATKRAASGVGNPNAPVKYNKMTAGADFIKKNRKSNTKLVTKTASKNPIKKTVKLPKFGTGARKYTTQRGADIAFGKSTAGKLAKKVGFKPSYALRKVATTAVKKGGLPAVVGLGLLSSPYARTAIKSALLGGGLSAFKSKKEPVAELDKEKKIGKTVKFSLSPKQKA